MRIQIVVLEGVFEKSLGSCLDLVGRAIRQRRFFRGILLVYFSANLLRKGTIMAGTVNKVILIGRLGADPEVRYTPDGTPLINFNIATNEPFRSAEGTWEERPQWHRIVGYGKLAENMGNFLSKGRLVYVEGKLQTRQWQDAQGAKRYTTEIVARDIKLMDSSGNRLGQTPPAESYARAGGLTSFSEEADIDTLRPLPSNPEDDIPF